MFNDAFTEQHRKAWEYETPVLFHNWKTHYEIVQANTAEEAEEMFQDLLQELKGSGTLFSIEMLNLKKRNAFTGVLLYKAANGWSHVRIFTTCKGTADITPATPEIPVKIIWKFEKG